eukprot:29339-Pelagococcus_subviridis.AAC.5
MYSDIMRFKNVSDALCALNSVSRLTSNISHADGGGSAPMSGGVASAASKHSKLFNHASMRSPNEYRIGSASWTSLSIRPPPPPPPPPSFPGAAAVADSLRKLLISFSDSARPVPSYPFTRNRRGFVDDEQLRRRRALVMLRKYVLDRLPVHPGDVYPDDRPPERRVRALDDVVVQVLFVPQRVEALQDELKKRLQVFRRRRRDEHVRVPHADRARDGDAHRRGLSSPARGGQRDSAPKRLLARGVEKRHDRFRLVQGFARGDERPRGFGVREGSLQVRQVLCLSAGFDVPADGLNIPDVRGYRQDI